MRKRLYISVLVIALALSIDTAAQTHKEAAPPSIDDMVGAWIGFDTSGSEFIRLELRSDGSGYLAVVSPANFVTRDYGVQVYRVTKWSIDRWKIICDLQPTSSNAEPAQASGGVFVSSLRLGLHGVSRRWKIETALYMESRLDGSNTETKNAIAAAEKK